MTLLGNEFIKDSLHLGSKLIEIAMLLRSVFTRSLTENDEQDEFCKREQEQHMLSFLNTVHWDLLGNSFVKRFQVTQTRVSCFQEEFIVLVVEF